MTDTERKRIDAICEVAGVKEIDDLSDGFHTFRQLYYQRMMLFATIVKQNKDKSWKSLRHEDGELCFGGGWFIVGIDTPEGSYTYHYEDEFYSLFDCEELERAKHWDGHTEKDVTRLLSLSSGKDTNVPSNDTISRQAALAETVHSEREEVTMGYLKEKHGVMMLGKTPEGTCHECAVKHEPRYPHDRNSITYQYKFYDQHGRWPTWADAMAHCDEAMREAWTEALKKRGVEV